MKTKKLSSDIRKEQIVRTALGIMGDKGSSSLKMADIASRLNLAPSALYRHFANKDAVLMAILDFIESNLTKNINAVRQQSELNAIDQLHKLLIRHTHMISLNSGIPKIIFSDEFWGRTANKRKRLYEVLSCHIKELEKLIVAGQAKKEISNTINPTIAARLFLGIIQPGALLSYMSEGEFDIEEHAALAWPVFKKILTDK